MEIGFPPIDPKSVVKIPDLPVDAKMAALIYGDSVLGVGSYRMRCVAHEWDRDNRRCKRCGMSVREYQGGPRTEQPQDPPELYEWI